jgi:PAS domain S-box-containing protein
MATQGHIPWGEKSDIHELLRLSLGDLFEAFCLGEDSQELPGLEAYESILYSLEKQDLIHVLRIAESLSAPVSVRRALHTLLLRLAELLEVSRISLVFLDSDRGVGTVVVSHEDPDFQGVSISLEDYPEILQSARTGAITVVENPGQDPLMHALRQDQLSRIQNVCLMALPLAFRGKVFSVLLIQKQRTEEGFTIRDVRICQLVLALVYRTIQKLCGERAVLQAGQASLPAVPEPAPFSATEGWSASVLFSGAPLGVLLVDDRNRIAMANPKASEITGHCAERLAGMDFDRIVPKERLESILRMRGQGRESSKDPLRYHLEYALPNGQKKVISFEVHSLKDRPGFAWVFLRDVTKEKQLEEWLHNKAEELVRANRSLQEARSSLLRQNEELQRTNERLEELHKMKTSFLAIATHEIRTPLSIILGYNRLLLQGKLGPLTEDQTRVLEESVQSCERLLQIVSDMLDFTRLESGKLVVQKRREDVVPLLKRVYRQMKMISERSGVRFFLDVQEDAIRFPFDPDRIEQVLVNLISNAIKFTPPEGSVTLSACRKEGADGDWVEVVVRDTGRGFPASMVDKAFDGIFPLVWSPEGMRGPEAGSGLGLGICKRIVEAHGGRIWLKSREGEGTTFVFCLPCEEDGSDFAEAAEAQRNSPK